LNTASIIVSLLVSKRHELSKVLLVSEFLFSVPVRHGKGGIVEFMREPSAHKQTNLGATTSRTRPSEILCFKKK
jgi:hypothetical protein